MSFSLYNLFAKSTIMKINNKLKPLFFIPVTVLYLIFFYNEYIFQIIEQTEIKNSLCSSWKNTESLIYNLSKAISVREILFPSARQ